MYLHLVACVCSLRTRYISYWCLTRLFFRPEKKDYSKYLKMIKTIKLFWQKPQTGNFQKVFSPVRVMEFPYHANV